MGEVFKGITKPIDDIVGTNMSGRNATVEARRAQEAATNKANDTQRYVFDQQREDNKEWLEAGKGALGGLTDMASGNYDMQTDPGYQFRLSEGLKAVNSNASARGNRKGGATMKALTRYGQNVASQEYNNQFNRLSSIAGIGQTANSQNAQAGMNYGNNVSANQIGMGNAHAAAGIAQAGRMSNLIGQGIQGASMAMASDKRLKENITSVSQQDMDEFRRTIKPYHYNYISDNLGKGDFTGVMAQDLEKSKLGKTVVFENKDGHKMVDLKKVMSLMLASMSLQEA